MSIEAKLIHVDVTVLETPDVLSYLLKVAGQKTFSILYLLNKEFLKKSLHLRFSCLDLLMIFHHNLVLQNSLPIIVVGWHSKQLKQIGSQPNMTV